MAQFKMNPTYAPVVNQMNAAIQFVVPSNATTPNAQVLQAPLTVGTAGVSQLTATSTLSPQGNKAMVFCTPNAAAAQPSNNPNRLPPGVVTTAQTAGSEFLIDCSGYPSDIINADASIVTPGRGAQTVEATIGAIDNVNKLIYVQVVGFVNGTPTAAPVGSIIGLQFYMSDSFAP